MPWKPGMRGINTPFKSPPSYKSKRTRIRIPQPIERPLIGVGKDVLKSDEFPIKPDWLTIHRRGIPRPRIGGDPLEARAAPETQVRGYLRERIVYKFLTEKMRLVEDVDFSFQSSQMGGRMQLGGMVVDFLFPILAIIIQVEGPTHAGFLRHRKDEEQEDTLRDMGYTVYHLFLDEIDDEYRFENKMRRIFNLHSGTGSSFGAYAHTDEDNEIDVSYIADLNIVNSLLNSVDMELSALG